MNNELSIYRKVLVFPRNILDLQGKMDSLIVTSKMIGYDIEISTSVSIKSTKCVRVSFQNDSISKVSFYFYYDREEEYIKELRCYYQEVLGEVEARVFRGDDIVNIGKMIDNMIMIM